MPELTHVAVDMQLSIVGCDLRRSATIGVNRTVQLREPRVERWERNSTYDPGAYQGGRAMGV
ncbi:hypothetical protein DLJ61_14595 [Gordonia terrae]|uniref:Uncharacterized protein n=1 Tax=Gordonia terrae TaxID=2055 RepID=A0AAD0KED8_9ACTN|nr:hypothetical protein BCM27_14465 [Gordonia terrae]AWO84566.1 hypothetical protein DLJ61_14595 [Gordonia terrae]